MELYSARICPYAERTRLVLHEKDVSAELIEIDLSAKPERFLEVSPYGKVPVIVHEGEAIYESAIINEYLDQVFAEPPLLPEGALAQARMRIWIDYCDRKFLDDYYDLLRNRDETARDTARDKVLDHLRTIETEGLAKLSGEGPFWFGTRPTLVDFAYFPFFERLPAWSHYRGLVLPDDCTRLKRWVAAMWMRSSVREIANPAQYYIEHYKGYASAEAA